MRSNTPDQCKNMHDIRSEIDHIDQSIIRLLSERSGYVHAAAKFKQNTQAVKANDRVKAMLAQRREWAEGEGLSPDIVEKVYKTLVEAFIQEEMETWKKR